MWKCHKCGKPVYFAERKQSLGYDWHPECLRCEECGKRLNPGQHAEHKGVPYCHVPCYGALFGPQLFGHGTRVESHKSFGQQQKESPKIGGGPKISSSHIEAKLKAYNQYYDGKSGEIRSREVNGRLVLEGSLRIHWGVHAIIHLKENDDQRTVVTVRKRNSYRMSSDFDSDEDTSHSTNATTCSSDVLNSSTDVMNSSTDTLSPDDKMENIEVINESFGLENEVVSTQNGAEVEVMPKSLTLPPKLDIKNMEWDELDELLQVERRVDETDKLYQTMPAPLPSQTSIDSTSSTYSDSSTTEKAEDLNSDFSKDSTRNGISEISTNTITLTPGPSDPAHLNRSMSGPDCLERVRHTHSPEIENSVTSTTSCDIAEISSRDVTSTDEVVIRRAPKTGSTAIKRRPGKRLSRSKIKRRCSINGHFYDRETSFFTPPHGSQMSVWVSSLVNTQEVINLMLEKYKVDSDGSNFALFVIRDNGEQRRLKENEYPLLSRVLLGPHEDVARLFLMDSHTTTEVSNEVAQFLNFTIAECKGILNQYHTEEDREVAKIKEKYAEMKRRIKQRMEELKVRL